MEVDQFDYLRVKFRMKLYAFAQMIVKLFNALERSNRKEGPGSRQSKRDPPSTFATTVLGGDMFRISCMNCLSCQRILAFDFALRWTHPFPTISPSIFSIKIYVQPRHSKAQWTFGTGIEVCWAIKHIADASERCLKGPYLTQSRSERRRMLPLGGRNFLSNLMPARTRNLLKMVSLLGGYSRDTVAGTGFP